MTRSPLTLAASVTAAVPQAAVIGVGELTEHAAGRYDCAVVRLDDGRDVVVRVPTDAAAAAELIAEVAALRALTPGVRAILPFRAPVLLGESGVGDARAAVVTYLDGYRIDAADLPGGYGPAYSVGVALAALHALPPAVLRDEDLPAKTPEPVRDELSSLLDRVEATERLPLALVSRWRRAVTVDSLWRFETSVVLGNAEASSFLYEDDVTAGSRVCGVLEWHGLSVGDPAVDLRWVASAPAAADTVHDAYAASSHRAPDAGLRTRARLYAELEFARWLLHGVETGRADIVTDAAGLLASLADGVGTADLFSSEEVGVDDALRLLERTPAADPPAVDTSMQTDAYDPGVLSMFLAEETAARAASGAPAHEDVATAPIDISSWVGDRDESDDDAPDQDESQRASRAAFQRWASSASE